MPALPLLMCSLTFAVPADGSVQIIPALLSQHQQPAPALQQKYTAIWGDRPPFSVCINNLPAGMPFEDIAALFRGAYVSTRVVEPAANRQ